MTTNILKNRKLFLVALLISVWAGAAASLTASAILRSHCVYVKNGYLKAESASPESLLREYDRESLGKPLVIHFHGGLVSEANAKTEALQLYGSCYGGRSYPIFFVWNADFFTELRAVVEAECNAPRFRKNALATLQEIRQKRVGASSAVADWISVATWRRLKDNFVSHWDDYLSTAIHAAGRYHDGRSVSWGGDLLECVSSKFGGPAVWARMKRDTAQSFAVRNGIPGAGLQFLQALARHPEIHRIVLVGHSTGCIYIANFLRAAKALMPNRKFDVVFLAPANSYADTAKLAREAGGMIGNFRMFAIRDSNERNDHMLWQINPSLEGLYPGSLLFFVSRAVEPRHNEPILGLQCDYPIPAREPDHSNSLTVHRMLLSRPGAVVWTPCKGPVGQCSTCVSHGDFCSDAATLVSLRHLIASSDWR